MKITIKIKTPVQRSLSLPLKLLLSTLWAAIFGITIFTASVGAQTPELQRILDKRQATLKRMEKSACGFNAGSCRMKGGKAVAEQERYKSELDDLD